MLSELQAIIEARLVATGLFKEVGTALTDGEKSRPSAAVWLVEDSEVLSTPGVSRDLVFGASLAVNHSETEGGAQAEIYAILDEVRTAFSGWTPPDVIAGIEPESFSVSMRLAEHQTKGPTEYVALIKCRVYPGAFATT